MYANQELFYVAFEYLLNDKCGVSKETYAALWDLGESLGIDMTTYTADIVDLLSDGRLRNLSQFRRLAL